MARKHINIKAKYDLRAFSESAQNLAREMRKSGRQMQNVGASMSKALTLPIVATGGIAVKTFADFEQSMAKVSAVSGATGKSLQNLEKLAKDLGISTRFTSSEVAELMLNYSKLGFTSSEIDKITASTLDLALATGEDLATSATVAGGTLRAFGLNANEMGRVTDVMAKSFSSSALDLAKFDVAMGTIAPVARGLGQSLEYTTAQLGVLTNNGIEASTAGTMLRNMMLAATEGGFSMHEALSDIAGSTDKAATSLKYFDKRATATALVLADNISNVSGLNETLLDSEGAAKSMAATMDNTLQGSLFKLKSAAEGLGISFGEMLAPTIIKIGEKVAKLAIGFSELQPETKRFIIVVSALAAAIGPLIYAFGALQVALAAMMAVPIVAAVTALTLGFVALKIAASESNKVFASVKTATDKMKEAYDSLGVELEKINVLKGKGSRASIEEIRISIASTKATIQKTNELIKENLARKQLLLTQQKQAEETAMAATRGVGRQGDFIDVELAAVKTIQANIKALSAEIKNLQSQGGSAVDGLIDLENQLKTLGTSSVSVAAGPSISTTKLKKSVEDVKETIEEAEKYVLGNAPDFFTSGKSLGQALAAGVTAGAANITEAFEENIKQPIEDFTKDLNKLIQSGAKDAVISLAEGMGQLVSGQIDISDFGRNMLSTVGDFMVKLGGLMIGFGITFEAFKESIEKMQPHVAVIAGIALVAIGSAIKGTMKKGLGSGSGGASTPSYGGGGGTNYNTGNLVMDTRVSGRDLLLVQQRESQFSR